jgi:hypothetical protein
MDIHLTTGVAVSAGLIALMIALFLLCLGFLAGWQGCLRRLRIDPIQRARAECFEGAPFGPFQPTHRHRKGTRYQALLRITREADLAPLIVYRDGDEVVWARPEAEFYDGRFEVLNALEKPLDRTLPHART